MKPGLKIIRKEVYLPYLFFFARALLAWTLFHYG